MKQNLAVLFGHQSCEHDISIITACQAMKNIDDTRYHVIPIYCTKDNQYLTGKSLLEIENYPNKISGKNITILPNSKNIYYKSGNKFKKGEEIDVALFCFHGRHGEDGAMQGLFELNDIPYSSIGVLGSSVASDKIVFKQLMNGLNIPTINSIWLKINEYYANKSEYIEYILSIMGLPLIVKPSTLGSSIGIKVCTNEYELANALENAFELDDRVLIEEYKENIKEINIAVLFDGIEYQFSEFEEVTIKDKILSFENKYIANNKGKTTSVGSYFGKNEKAKLSKSKKAEMLKYCKSICDILKLKGVVRFDYILSDEKIYINEINTIPGSMANYLFKEKYTYMELLTTIIQASIFIKSQNENIIYSFDSSVLVGYRENKLK